jgi:hypothetical protein
MIVAFQSISLINIVSTPNGYSAASVGSSMPAPAAACQRRQHHAHGRSASPCSPTPQWRNHRCRGRPIYTAGQGPRASTSVRAVPAAELQLASKNPGAHVCVGARPSAAGGGSGRCGQRCVCVGGWLGCRQKKGHSTVHGRRRYRRPRAVKVWPAAGVAHTWPAGDRRGGCDRLAEWRANAIRLCAACNKRRQACPRGGARGATTGAVNAMWACSIYPPHQCHCCSVTISQQAGWQPHSRRWQRAIYGSQGQMRQPHPLQCGAVAAEAGVGGRPGGGGAGGRTPAVRGRWGLDAGCVVVGGLVGLRGGGHGSNLQHLAWRPAPGAVKLW